MEDLIYGCGSSGYLTSLSDEVLLMIFKYLSSQDLYNLIRTCSRFKYICQEDILWTNVECPEDTKDVVFFTCSKLLNPKSRSLKLISRLNPFSRAFRSSLCPSICQILVDRGRNLSELHLVRQLFDSKLFSLLHLPEHLKVLSLSGCYIANITEDSHYFKDISHRFKVLEDLDLSYCSWVSAHSLMALSKLPNLRKLNLRGCRSIGNCLPYAALSSRFGFSKLKILDVTDTNVSSSEFTSFTAITTLEEFYFGQYDHYIDHPTNYITDFCLVALRNSETIKVLDMSGSKVTDLGLDVLQSISNLVRVDAHFTSLTDSAIAQFHRIKPTCRIKKVPDIFGDAFPKGNCSRRELYPLSSRVAVEIFMPQPLNEPILRGMPAEILLRPNDENEDGENVLFHRHVEPFREESESDVDDSPDEQEFGDMQAVVVRFSDEEDNNPQA